MGKTEIIIPDEKSDSTAKSLFPINGIDNEKQKWLDEIGLKRIPKDCAYYVNYSKNIMFYSEEYIKNASLDDLQAKHDWNLKTFCEKNPQSETAVREGYTRVRPNPNGIVGGRMTTENEPTVYKVDTTGKIDPNCLPHAATDMDLGLTEGQEESIIGT